MEVSMNDMVFTITLTTNHGAPPDVQALRETPSRVFPLHVPVTPRQGEIGTSSRD